MTDANKQRPTVIGVGGFSSNSGKTTLVCELLRSFPGWEAIKMTRGHYRSCGKDAHACCVSGLLAEEPVVRSGRDETYALGKDTGRYWDAGAANVHWVIVVDSQIEAGFNAALARVKSEGVFVEGNSFLRHFDADFVVTAAARSAKIKPTARRVLHKTSALYLFDRERDGDDASTAGALAGDAELISSLSAFTPAELPGLVERVRAVHAARGSVSHNVSAGSRADLTRVGV